MPNLPLAITYGKVVGRFVLAVGDTPSDPDLNPDARVPTNFKVTFAPKGPVIKVTDPPTTVIPKPVIASLNADGYVVDDSGNEGVWLITGVYTVSYASSEVSLSAYDILVETGATVDLSTALPAGTPATPSQYAELNTRLAVLEADGGGAPAEHTHTAADITDFDAAVDARIPAPVDTSDFVSSVDVTAIDVMTQDAYDALAVKDPTTLYVIQG